MTDNEEIDPNELGALLVFLANGTLQGAERAAIEEAVANDPELQTELDALKAIRREMQSADVGVSPGEFGLARLARDISTETSERMQPETGRSRFWEYAAAAAVALFALQTAIVFVAPDQIVELAGGGEDEASGPTLIVAFEGNATEQDIRALLLELDLTIVDGPSALGLYTLAAIDEAGRTKALAALKRRSDLVESAEQGSD